MRAEDWQAYQAGRTGQESGGPASPPPKPPQYYAPRARRSGMGWPLAILLLGLGLIGGCTYTVGKVVDSIGPAIQEAANKAAEPGVGVLVVEDEIAGSVWATTAIHGFAEDDNIKSLVVRINSPGGSVAPCQEIYNALKAFEKPVVVSMGSVAASGGLYIAAAGDLILANPGTITGSIGVIMQSVEVGGTMEKIGLKSETVKSGEYKDMGSPYRPMLENERALLQNMVNEVYEQFLADLIKGRANMEATAVRRLADGRIYSGAEARRLGLVDQLGGFEEALLIAAERGGLAAGVRPPLTIEDGRRPWWEQAFKGQSAVNLEIPPALTPGFSMKYLYQPNIGGN